MKSSSSFPRNFSNFICAPCFIWPFFSPPVFLFIAKTSLPLVGSLADNYWDLRDETSRQREPKCEVVFQSPLHFGAPFRAVNNKWATLARSCYDRRKKKLPSASTFLYYSADSFKAFRTPVAPSNSFFFFVPFSQSLFAEKNLTIFHLITNINILQSNKNLTL